MARKPEKKRRQHKTGSVRFKRGKWYIRWFDAHGERKEAVGGNEKAAAENLLRQRIAEAQAGQLTSATKAVCDVTIGDCLQLALADAKERRLASAEIMTWRINSSLAETARLRAIDYTYQHAWRYIEARRKLVSDSTINRELSQLRGAFKLAASARHKLIPAAPEIPHLKEPDNVRTGFLTPSEYSLVRSALPEELRGIFCCAYYTGLRRGSLLNLRLHQVDLENKLIWVRRSQVKNQKSQTSPILDGEMFAYCAWAVERNKEYLFEWEPGRKIKNFRSAWEKAVTRAGMPDLQFHDLRRTAVRDWIQAGAPESTVMMISGHKTNSMLQRYNILDAEVIKKISALRNQQPEAAPDLIGAGTEPVQNGANWGPALSKKPS
jgi:integrase